MRSTLINGTELRLTGTGRWLKIMYIPASVSQVHKCVISDSEHTVEALSLQLTTLVSDQL